MKVKISWRASSFHDGMLIPVIEVLNAKKGINGEIITGVFMDDGGGGNKRNICGVAELMENLSKVKNGELMEYCWGRNSWLADVSLNEVKIEFQFDDEYFEKISFGSFYKIALAWSEFINSHPDLTKVVEFEVSN